MMSLLRSLAAIGFTMLAVPAVAQQFTMKVSSPTANDVATEWAKTFKAAVESRAGGKIKVEFYPANQLGQIPATVEGVALGTIEVTMPATGFLVSLEPRFAVFDLPGIFNDMAHAQRVLADPETIALYSKFGAAKGVETIHVMAHSPTVIASHKPIRTVADMQNQKMRVIAGTPLFIETARKLGVSPIAMPLGEVLPALQNRTLDSVVTGLTVITAFKYFDVVKGATIVPGGIVSIGALTNQRFLRSIGPELEKVVREEAIKAIGAVAQFGLSDAAGARDVWRKNGGEAIDLDAAETKKYVDLVTSALPPMLAANAALKADYETMLRIASKHR